MSWVVVMGTFATGHHFIGPFYIEQDAFDWAEGIDETWEIIPIGSPDSD